MIGRDHITLGQVRNRPCQLQHAVERPRRQVQLLHRCLQQLLPGGVCLATLPHLRRPHLRVTRQLRPPEALQLPFPRCLHPATYRLRAFYIALIGQFLIINAGHLHMNIDAVQQWAADALLVARNRHRRTTALFHRVPPESTWAPVRAAVATSLLRFCCTFATSFGSRTEDTLEKTLQVEQ